MRRPVAVKGPTSSTGEEEKHDEEEKNTLLKSEAVRKGNEKAADSAGRGASVQYRRYCNKKL